MDPAPWDDEEDQPKEEWENSAWGGRDGLIFLIDATNPMFKADSSNEPVPFELSLKCCHTTMLNKIISSEKDMIAVVLFGTSKTDNVLNVAHITVLQQLEQPGAEKIKQLENMLKWKENNFDGFDTTYGHSDDYAISDALWLCQSLFSNCQLKMGSQRILLFTNTDNPHSGSVHKQHQARNKASDLGQIGIDVDLLHLGKNFDPSVFYKEVIQLVKNEDAADWRLPNPSTKFDELLSRIVRKDHKKRSVGKLHFTLGEGLVMSVGVYNLVRPTIVPVKAQLDKSTNEVVKSSIKKFNAETGEVLLATELNKYQDFGFKKIVMKPPEVRDLHKLMDPGMKLLGFKPAARVNKIHHHIKPSSFIYPEESLIQGSRKLFTALLNRCIAKKVVPICIFSPRVNSSPSLVALIPQEELLDDSNIQVLAPGFHVVFLPYAEDIRTLNFESVKVEPEQLEKAKKLVKKLKFGYSPYRFENPKLQTHWSVIEALALDYDEQREVKDLTLPDYDKMSERLNSLAKEFLDSVYVSDYVPGTKPKPSASKKRAIEGDSDKPKKVVKTMDYADMRDTATCGQVEKLKADVLKAFLTSQGVRVKNGTKKGDLVTRVYQHLGIDQPN